MRQVWTSEDSCTLDGVRFEVGKADFDALKTTRERVWVLKEKQFFDRYDSYFGSSLPRTVFEIGVFEGGSAILLADRWPDAKIVGIDIREPNPEVAGHVERLGLVDRISLYYGVSQNDAGRIRQIISTEFPGGLDVVIDDASHLYELTRQSFEAVFPLLRPGGLYIVEDWGWAHWRDWQTTDQWKDQPALTNLLFELTMLCATSAFVVSEIYTNGSFFAARKAHNCPTLDRFTLADFYMLRGKVLPTI